MGQVPLRKQHTKGRRSARQRLLVVEADPTVRGKLAAGVRRSGSQVVSASSLEEAQQLSTQTQPDLVLATLDLPDAEGLAVFVALCSDPAMPPAAFMGRCLRGYRRRVGRWLDTGLAPERPSELLRCDCRQQRAKPQPLLLADCLPLCVLTGLAFRVELIQHSRTIGTLLVAKGQVLSCNDGQGDGAQALRRLMSVERALVTCAVADPDELPFGSSIDWLPVVFEGASPGWQSDAFGPETPSTALPTTPQSREAALEIAFTDGVSAVREGRLEEARQHMCAIMAIDPSHRWAKLLAARVTAEERTRANVPLADQLETIELAIGRPTEAQERSLLLLDDDARATWALGRRLLRAGYGVATATHAREAICILENGAIDAVLIDPQKLHLRAQVVIAWLREHRPGIAIINQGLQRLYQQHHSFDAS